MKNNSKCKLLANCRNFSDIEKKFIKLGEKRFKKFAVAQTKDILLIGKNATLLKSFFKAAGYKKNQLNFLELFERFMSYPYEISSKYYEAILWGESNLLPEMTTNQIHKDLQPFYQQIWEQWWRIRKPKKRQIKWIKHGIRPQNHPERRIAAICKFIKNFSIEPFAFFYEEINKAKDIKIFEKNIYSLIQQNDNLWNNFYNFKKSTPINSAIFGKSRANDFIINGLLPTLYAQTMLPENDNGKFHNDILTDRSKILHLWLSMKNSVKNQITIEVSERCNLTLEEMKIISKSNACSQGAIELYKEYCSPCLQICKNCNLDI